MNPLRMSILVGVVLFAAALNFEAQLAPPRLAGDWRPTYDRTTWPAALRNVPVDRLSSGALLRLDRGGDVVEPPSATTQRLRARTTSASGGEQPAAAVSLDRRVGSNIRLGDDPPALPSNQRAQAEPHIVRAPNETDFLLATFQEGRYTDGGAIDCGYSVSHNGGLTWTRALIPKLTTTTGGPFFRATDPVAAVDLNGNAYLNTDAATDANFNTGAVVVSRSTDGGNSFGSPVVVYQSPNQSVFPDKNWMAVNNFAGTPGANRVIVTWTSFNGQHTNSGPIVRSYSDDHGTTWSTASVVDAAHQDDQGSQPVFLANGRLAVVYWSFNETASFADDSLRVAISSDGGTSFTASKLITPVAIYSEPSIRSDGFLPAVATDRSTGSIYVVYQARYNGSPKILFTKSSNNGDTWTTPVPISDNPTGLGVFNPTIAASPDGTTLTASFYDHRNNPGSTTLVDMYLAQSFDGGATWQPNIRLTSTSSDATLAPNTGTFSNPAYMLGDYLGIAESTSPDVPAVPVWIDTRTGNPDPFVGRVGIAPALDFRSWQAARLSLGQINNPQLGGEAGDADADGEDNLSEFRSDTDPNNPLSVFRSGRQLNISTRALVDKGGKVLIGGFIVTGNESKPVLVRALGPSLQSNGVAGALLNPTLDLHNGNGSIAFNDDWRADDAAAIEATGLPPTDNRESAIVRSLAPGSYTAIVRGQKDTTGVALVEAYDLAGTNTARLANVSSRGFARPGDDVIIGGIIIGAGSGVDGAGTAHVIVRGIGPSLQQSGVTDYLQDPDLQLADENGTVIAENDNWQETQQAEIQASGIAPQDSREAAAIVVLPKGAYTIVLRGNNNGSGTALVEAYNIP